MRHFLTTVVAAVAVIGGVVASATPATANSDPHRTFMPSAPLDLPAGYCAFPVHIDWLQNREYAKVSVLPDGSTTFTVEGALIASIRNGLTGRTVKVNASGVGSITVSADGARLTYDATGTNLIPGTNLTTFGWPSNLVQTSGPIHFVQEAGFGAVTSLSVVPPTMTDVCAALS